MAFPLPITKYILKLVSHLPIDGELLRVSDYKLNIFITFIQESMSSTNPPGEVPIPSLSFLRGRSMETPPHLLRKCYPSVECCLGRGVGERKSRPAAGEEGRREGSQCFSKEAWYPFLSMFLALAATGEVSKNEKLGGIRTRGCVVYLTPDGTRHRKGERPIWKRRGQGNEELYRQSTLPLKTLNPCLHLFLSKLPSSRPSSEGRVNVLFYFFFPSLGPHD